MHIRPIKNRVLISQIEQGFQLTKGGIILPDDTEFHEKNIKNRWGLCYKCGPEVKEIEPGDWLLIRQGRWSRGIDFVDEKGQKITLRVVDYPDGILLVANELQFKTL